MSNEHHDEETRVMAEAAALHHRQRAAFNAVCDERDALRSEIAKLHHEIDLKDREVASSRAETHHYMRQIEHFKANLNTLYSHFEETARSLAHSEEYHSQVKPDLAKLEKTLSEKQAATQRSLFSSVAEPPVPPSFLAKKGDGS